MDQIKCIARRFSLNLRNSLLKIIREIVKHKNSILGKILDPLSLELLLIGKTIWSGWASTLTCCQSCGTHHIMIMWLFFLPFGLMPRISELFMILGAKVLTWICFQSDLPPTPKGNPFTPGQSTLQDMGQSSKGISNQHLFFSCESAVKYLGWVSGMGSSRCPMLLLLHFM